MDVRGRYACCFVYGGSPHQDPYYELPAFVYDFRVWHLEEAALSEFNLTGCYWTRIAGRTTAAQSDVHADGDGDAAIGIVLSAGKAGTWRAAKNNAQFIARTQTPTAKSAIGALVTTRWLYQPQGVAKIRWTVEDVGVAVPGLGVGGVDCRQSVDIALRWAWTRG